MLLAARLRGIKLGSPGPKIYRLTAISIAPAALTQFFTPILNFLPLGGLVVWIIQFILFFRDTWYCVWTILLKRIGFHLLLNAVIPM